MLNNIKRFYTKQKQVLIVISTAFLAILSFINFYFIFNVTAQSNDECLWSEKIINGNNTIVFEQVKVDGVTWKAGIRDGDYLFAIDGTKTYNALVATKVLDKISYGDYATYKVVRNGNEFETKVFVKKLIDIGGLSINLMSLIWLLVAFVVVMSKVEGKIQNLFYRVAIFSVFYSTTALVYRGQQVDNIIFQSQVLVSLVAFSIAVGVILFPIALVHFFSVFPREYPFVSKKWFKIIFYKVSVGFFLIYYCILGYEYFLIKKTPISNVLGVAIFFMGFALFILAFILLAVNYYKLPTKKERKPILIILIAFLIAVLARIYFTFLAQPIVGLAFNNPQYFTPILLIALVPIAFGYSIFKYSLMDIKDFVKNAIVYGVATFTVAGIYYFVIYLLGQLVSSAVGTEYQVMIAGAVFVVFSFVFQSTKDKFQNILTEKFYPEQFTFQKALLKFSSEIASTVGKENIFDSIQELFVHSLRIQTFGLLLKNEDNLFNLIRHKGINDLDLNLVDDDFHVANYCLECNKFGKKQVLERQDFKEVLGDSSEKFLSENIYTIIPLFIKSKIIGFLLFGLKQSGSQFAGKDLDLLIAAATQTAISIDTARLYESEAEKQKLERDLENARRIQETLLPKTFPQIDRLDIAGKMIPAMHVGGDYFDLIKISDKKLFVVIGDVSGKGLSASFYMSKLQTMIGLYCTEGKSPSEILVEVNKKIYENIEKNWFITVSLAFFDSSENSVKFCRAGHTPLIRIRNKIVEEFQPSGLGVGLERGELFQSSLEEITIPFKPNDLFLNNLEKKN
ncbi:MAG: SpoIIE family protein phosphatase [Ignavibacteriales bacterium]|nr:SpoIIE family protein phosphatase [Ignavibacteriales bacterium]